MQSPSVPSVDEVIQVDIDDVMNNLLGRVAGLCAKRKGVKQLTGKKHYIFTAQFKAEVIHKSEAPGATQSTKAEKYRITQGQVSC